MDLNQLGVKRAAFTLSNGLRGIVFERPNAPVHVRLAFKAGTRYDPTGKEGSAHFLEHMITSGTKRFPTKSLFANHVERYGGTFGASTPMEEMYLNVTIGDPADLEVAFDTLGQMMTDSRFADDILENERQAVLGEIGNWQANPGHLIADARYRLLYAGTPSGRSYVGTPEATQKLQKADLQTFLREALTADRGLIVVSGGVTSAQVKALAEKYVAAIPAHSSGLTDGELPINRTNAVLIEKRENQQLQISFSFRTPPIGSPDDKTLGLLATIMGGGRAASLSRLLREEQGLVYSVNTGATTLTSGSFIATNTTVDKSKLQRVIDGIIQEHKRLATSGPTQDEVDFAIQKRLKSLRMQLQTSTQWVDFHSHTNLLGDKGWTVSDYARDLQSLDKATLQAAASKHFTSDNWYLALVGDVARSEFEINF